MNLSTKDQAGQPAADCIFCRIAGGNLPSVRIYEDRDFLAFLDIAPQTEGHFLLITRRHYETLAEVPDKVLAKALPLARKLAAAALTGLGVAGFNLLQNNGEVAGQAVPHWHLHVIPRRRPEELPFRPGPPADPTRLPFVAENIRLNIKA